MRLDLNGFELVTREGTIIVHAPNPVELTYLEVNLLQKALGAACEMATVEENVAIKRKREEEAAR